MDKKEMTPEEKRKLKIQTLREMIKPKHGYRIATVDPIIIQDRKVLLQKRSFGKFEGYWVLPGGKVEKSEDTWAACVREAKEETGLDVSIVRMVGFYDDPERDPEKNAVSIAFLCRPMDPGQEPRLSEEATDIKWFSLDKLPENIGFDHERIITDAAKEIA